MSSVPPRASAVRSGDGGFLGGVIYHLRRDALGWGGTEGKEGGEEGQEGGKREEEEVVNLYDGKVRRSRERQDTNTARGESKKMPVGSMQLITADGLCLDSSPWQQDGPAGPAGAQEDTDEEIDEQTDKAGSETTFPPFLFIFTCVFVKIN